MIQHFSQIEALMEDRTPRSVAVAMAEEEDVLKAIAMAADHNIAEPILVGSERSIREIAEKAGLDVSSYTLHDTQGEEECAQLAVDLVNRGEAECLMKGKVPTATIMKTVMKRQGGLRSNKALSHITLVDFPFLDKLTIATDCALNIEPDMSTKISILENAAEFAKKLGVETPKAAVVAAVEKINPTMQITSEAAVLAKMSERGQFKDFYVDGPFALDNAFSIKSRWIKGIHSEFPDIADIILFPDIEAGNTFYKTIGFLTDYDMAGIIVGAQVPIILTSRSDKDRIKFLSILTGIALT